LWLGSEGEGAGAALRRRGGEGGRGPARRRALLARCARTPHCTRLPHLLRVDADHEEEARVAAVHDLVGAVLEEGALRAGARGVRRGGAGCARGARHTRCCCAWSPPLRACTPASRPRWSSPPARLRRPGGRAPPAAAPRAPPQRTCLSVRARHLRTISASSARFSSTLSCSVKYLASRVWPCLLTSRRNLMVMAGGGGARRAPRPGRGRAGSG
jgi:hypothetical protein